MDDLERQIGDLPVEHLILIDNKQRSIGLKRDALVQSARGDYLAFVDDDDEVHPSYITKIIEAILEAPHADVIVFNQLSSIDGGNKFIVRFGIEYENQEAHSISHVWQDITRKPFHVCVWRRTIAQAERFADASYGEDWDWCKRLLKRSHCQYRIPFEEPLHRYFFRRGVTEAEATFP